MSERTSLSITFARHERVLRVEVNKYSHSLVLHLGAFPIISQVSLGEIRRLPMTYYLLEELRSHGDHGSIFLPNDVKVHITKAEHRGYSRTHWNEECLYLFEIPKSSGRLKTAAGPVYLTVNDYDALLETLLQIWRDNVDLIKKGLYYQHRPELAEPPEPHYYYQLDADKVAHLVIKKWTGEFMRACTQQEEDPAYVAVNIKTMAEIADDWALCEECWKGVE